MGGNREGSFLFEENRFLRFSTQGLQQSKIYALAEDQQQRLWVGLKDKVRAYRGNELVAQYGAGDGLQGLPVKAVFPDPRGVLWVGTETGVAAIEEDKVKFISSAKGLPLNDVRTIVVDHEGMAWFGGLGGVAKFLGLAFTNYTAADGLGSDIVRFVLRKRDGALWAATSRGLSRFDGKRWQTFTTKDGLNHDYVVSLFEDRSGKLWIGNYGGLNYFDGNRFHDEPEISQHGRVVHIAEDKSDALWCSVQNVGVFKRGSHGYERVEVPGQTFSNARLLLDRKGHVWVSGDHGLSRWNGKSWRTFTTSDGVSDNEPYYLCEDLQGNIWLGYHSSRGVTRYDGERFQTYTTKDGLVNDAVYSVGVDHNNNLWIGTARGVDRFDGHTFVNYGTAEGYVSQESNAGGFFADHDGTLWFGTADGLSHYDPRFDISGGAPPRVVVHRLVLGDSAVSVTHPPEIAYSNNDVYARVAILSYINEKRLQSRYRLHGYDHDWKILHGYEINYTNLPPRAYALEVQARKYQGEWSRSAIAHFIIRAPFWQTWWFILLIIGFGSALVLGIIKVRTHTLETQRRRLETTVQARTEELRQKNAELEKLSLAVSKSDNLVLIADAHGVIEWVNEGFTRLTGYTLNEWRQEKGHTLSASSAYSEIDTLISKCMQRKDSQLYESRTVTRDGREIWLSSTLTPIFDQAGHLTRLVVIDTDITERKRAEQAQQQSQQKHAELVNSIDGIVWEADAQTLQFTFVSQKTERLLGYPIERWLSEPTFWKDHLHPEDRDWVLNFCVSATAEKRAHEFEYRMLTADGRIVWLKDYVSVVVENDQPSLLQGIMVDITERKRAEEQLRKLSRAIEQSPSSVVITDTQGRMEYVNPRFTAVTGYTPEDAIGQNPRILKSGQIPAEVYKQLWETITSGGEWRGELHNKKKNGELYWEYASISPIKNEQGAITHFLAVKEDITARKQMEAELQKAKEAAEAANRAKSEFLANMSHEIRTPLNSIIGMCELAIETELTTEQRNYLQVVSNSSEALLALINDILDFSKIEAGQLEIEWISFNLKELVEGVGEMMSVRALTQGLELLCYVEPSFPTFVVGDPTRLRQILINLVGNAIKFTERGEVVLEVRPEAESEEREAQSKERRSTPDAPRSTVLHFSVRDTGRGISPEQQGRLFQKFSQADSSTTRKFGGTGLGLSLSKSLVELMGGHIWLESEIGKGSTFHFTIGLAIGEGKEVVEYGSRDFGEVRVLVVDDNHTNRLILEKTLSSWGFQVQMVASGAQALALLSGCQTPFNIIILDHQMPEMDGVQVARTIRSEPKWQDIKIIVLSSWDGLKKQQQAELGIAEALTKPVKQSQLFNVMLRLVGGEKSEQVVDTESRAGITQPVRAGQRILLVEDNHDNQNLAKKILEKAGYKVDIAENGVVAVKAAQTFQYDLILMDIQMPEMDGFAATREIRSCEKSSKSRTGSHYCPHRACARGVPREMSGTGDGRLHHQAVKEAGAAGDHREMDR